MLLRVLLFIGLTIFPAIHISHVCAFSSTTYLTNLCFEENSKSRNEPYTVSATCCDLEEAILSHLSLSRVPKFPVNMSLKKLNLSHNGIVSIPKGSLLKLVELEVIDLSHNRILTVHEDAGLGELLNLQKIYLNNNRLGVVKVNMFEGMSELNLVHLQNNRDLCLQCLLLDRLCNFKGMFVVANCNIQRSCVNHFFIENNQCKGHPIDLPSCSAATVTHPPSDANTAAVTHPSNTATVTHPSTGTNASTVTDPLNTATGTHPSAGTSKAFVSHHPVDASTATVTHPSSTVTVTQPSDTATVTYPSGDTNTATVTHPSAVVTMASGTPLADTHTAATGPFADGSETHNELLKSSYEHPFWMNSTSKLTIGCGVCGIILNLVTGVIYFSTYWRIQISFSIQKIE